MAEYTDAQRGMDYNHGFSMRCSQSVIKAPVNDQGIKAARIRAEYVGKAPPLAANRTDQGRAKSRRGELVSFRADSVAGHEPHAVVQPALNCALCEITSRRASSSESVALAAWPQYS